MGLAAPASRATAARRDARDTPPHRHRDGDGHRDAYGDAHATPGGDTEARAKDATPASSSAPATTRAADTRSVWLHRWPGHKRQHLFGFLLVTDADANLGRDINRNGYGDVHGDRNVYRNGVSSGDGNGCGGRARGACHASELRVVPLHLWV